MTDQEALELVIAKTGNPHYRDRVTIGHKKYNPAFWPRIRELAGAEPQYPSAGRQIMNAVGAAGRVFKNMATGQKPVVSKEEQERRISICQRCDKYDPAQGRCTLCGCLGKFKTWLSTEDCPIGRWTPSRAVQPPLTEWDYVTAEQLTQDTVALAAEIPHDIDTVVGIARSGLIPAALIASIRHVPLYTVTGRHGLHDPGHGGRMAVDVNDPRSLRPELIPKHVLLIDDTAALGREITRCTNHVKDRWPDVKVTRCAVYCHPNVAGYVDICYRYYPGNHYLEWNWPNAGHGEACAYDFDGILTEEWYEGRTDENARPLYVPRRRSVPLIVTARKESRRAASEAWLARWGICCGRLVMREFEPANWNQEVGEWKGRIYGQSECTLFAESDPEQAKIIAAVSGRRVLCPRLGRVI